MKVFISYGSSDRIDALKIRKILVEKGCKVWFDAFDINPSKNLDMELKTNIEQVDLFCLLLSPTSVSSKWVDKEISWAMNHCSTDFRILPILLRPCQIPNKLCGMVAFRAYDGYQGFDDEHIRLQFTRKIFGDTTVDDVVLDTSFQKYFADVAEQRRTAILLPELIRQKTDVQNDPIHELMIQLNPEIVLTSIYNEDPYIIQLKLEFNNIFDQPISFFFTPFAEGNTWPPEFGFDEPDYNRFRDDQQRIAGKLIWYGRVEDIYSAIDGTDLGLPYCVFHIAMDGSEFLPSTHTTNGYHVNIALKKNFEIPPISKLINDKSRFSIIIHKILSSTAEEIDVAKSDIDIIVKAYFRNCNKNLILYKSRHDELEKILLSGEDLNNLLSPIEKEIMLGLYLDITNEKEDNSKERRRIHNLLLNIGPEEIESEDDRRHAIRVQTQRNNLNYQRGIIKTIFNWNDPSDVRTNKIINFLIEDFKYQDFFAHLIYTDLDEIYAVKTEMNPTMTKLEIFSSNNILIIDLTLNDGFALVLLKRTNKPEFPIFNLLAPKQQNDISIKLAHRLTFLNGCEKVRFLAYPLVFQRRPKHSDAYYLLNANLCIAKYFIYDIKRDELALNYVEESIEIAKHMINYYPKQYNYLRWYIDSLTLRAIIELKQKQMDNAKDSIHLLIELHEELFSSVPNKYTLKYCLLSIENIIELFPKKSLFKDSIINELISFRKRLTNKALEKQILNN